MANAETRPTIDVRAAVGGWPHPWPNVAEIARVLPSDRWSLIGGLMTQLHAIDHGIDAVRPTNDVDIVLHVETTRGTPNATASALESLGYEMKENLDPRNNVGHRFTRGGTHVGVVSSDDADIVDVVVADYAAPSVEERMRLMGMVKIPGGTQALRRTVNYRLEIEKGGITTISVPRPFGALILKAAAYANDSRDPERHLFDAAVLLTCIDNPIAERESFTGSDRSRMLVLKRELVGGHPAWLRIPVADARRGQAVLRAMCAAEGR